MFDCHTHSRFSGDCDTDERLACESAISKGLSGLAFTDHYDPDYPNMNENFVVDFEKYRSAIHSVKEEYKDKLHVVYGIELGLEEHTMEESSKIIDKYQFSQVIGSFHVIDRLELHNGDFTNGKTKREAYERYLEKAVSILQKFDNFDILGHFDIIRRYGNYHDKKLPYQEYADWIDEGLKIIIQKGKAMEVNTSGYRYGLSSPMPDFDIVKRYKELGGELICFSSDAHYAEHLCYKFDEISQIVTSIGFSYATYFDERKPVLYKI